MQETFWNRRKLINKLIKTDENYKDKKVSEVFELIQNKNIDELRELFIKNNMLEQVSNIDNLKKLTDYHRSMWQDVSNLEKLEKKVFLSKNQFSRQVLLENKWIRGFKAWFRPSAIPKKLILRAIDFWWVPL